MGIAFNFGIGATGAAVTKSLAPWAWTTAFRTVSDTGTVARVTDILAPLDKRTSIKTSLSRIANVYSTLASDTVPVDEQSSNTSGQTVFVELQTLATKTVGERTVQLPMVSRIELRLPNDADIAESDITTLVMATFAGLCDASGNPTVVTEKMRGALTPTGI